MKDEIKNIKIHTLPCSFIFNEDDCAGQGTHWVVVYIDEDNTLDFYDSFGEEPKMKELKDFIKPFNLNYNKIQIQSDESAASGQ